MVFGTFDGVHDGHLDFFRQAKELAGDAYLIVSIARDCNVQNIKGKNTEFLENKRKSLVNKCRAVDKVVLAGKTKYLEHILKEKPDIIALGYDQKAYVQELKFDLKKNGLAIKVVRMKAYKPRIFKNHLLKK